MSSEEIEFHRSGEWTGVYVDGQLIRAGEHYLADEWLQERVGVTVIDSDAWLPDGRNPLGTLAEVREETERRAVLMKRAADLRQEAQAALGAAEEFERQARHRQT